MPYHLLRLPDAHLLQVVQQRTVLDQPARSSVTQVVPAKIIDAGTPKGVAPCLSVHLGKRLALVREHASRCCRAGDAAPPAPHALWGLPCFLWGTAVADGQLTPVSRSAPRARAGCPILWTGPIPKVHGSTRVLVSARDAGKATTASTARNSEGKSPSYSLSRRWRSLELQPMQATALGVNSPNRARPASDDGAHGLRQ